MKKLLTLLAVSTALVGFVGQASAMNETFKDFEKYAQSHGLTGMHKKKAFQTWNQNPLNANLSSDENSSDENSSEDTKKKSTKKESTKKESTKEIKDSYDIENHPSLEGLSGMHRKKALQKLQLGSQSNNSESKLKKEKFEEKNDINDSKTQLEIVELNNQIHMLKLDVKAFEKTQEKLSSAMKNMWASIELNFGKNEKGEEEDTVPDFASEIQSILGLKVEPKTISELKSFFDPKHGLDNLLKAQGVVETQKISEIFEPKKEEPKKEEPKKEEPKKDTSLDELFKNFTPPKQYTTVAIEVAKKMNPEAMKNAFGANKVILFTVPSNGLVGLMDFSLTQSESKDLPKGQYLVCKDNKPTSNRREVK